MELCPYCKDPILEDNAEICDSCRKLRMNGPEFYICAFCGKGHENPLSVFCSTKCQNDDTKLP